MVRIMTIEDYEGVYALWKKNKRIWYSKYR